MIHCNFCQARVETIEAAIAANWIPSFYYDGEDFETPNPVCAKCQSDYLELADDGEMVYRQPAREPRQNVY